MKKKLEADLISIAHRILQMKNKSDVNQLYVETQKLYEKLAVLKFVEEHFAEAKPTIGQAEVVEKMKAFFETIAVQDIQKPAAIIPPSTEENIPIETVEEKEISAVAMEEEKAAEEKIEEVVVEAAKVEEEIIPLVAEEPVAVESLPISGLKTGEKVVTEVPKKEIPQISFEELGGVSYDDTLFVKVDATAAKANPLDFELPKVSELSAKRPESIQEVQPKPIVTEQPKTTSTIDKPVTGINIGLNDRIAFVKHLFGNSNEDYIRVLNQLITFDSYEEAHSFIEDMVKPDYNNWEGKEDYSERFLQIIEKKFA